MCVWVIAWYTSEANGALSRQIHSGVKKSPGQKYSWNQINQFHDKIFWPKSIFCNFKNGQKSIFELGKSLKLPKMQFHEEKNYLFDFTSFFGLDFFRFSGPLCKNWVFFVSFYWMNLSVFCFDLWCNKDHFLKWLKMSLSVTSHHRTAGQKIEKSKYRSKKLVKSNASKFFSWNWIFGSFSQFKN